MQPSDLTRAEKTHLAAKDRVAEAAYALMDGTGSVEKYDAARHAFDEAYPKAAGVYGPLNPTTLGTPRALTMRQIPQSTDWWCGPAAASMMILQLFEDDRIDTTRSQYGKRPPRAQKHLRKPNYLDASPADTDPDLVDGTYRTDMRRGMNRWIDLPYYAVKNNPTTVDFKEYMAADITNGWSFAVAAYEPPDAVHYNNHPTSADVDHWVPAHGYVDGFDTTKFADSAANSTLPWPDAEPHFTFDTKAFVSTWVHPSKAIVA